MAFVAPKDRVFEQSTSSSQTVFTVTGAVDAGYNAFSASMSIGDTTIGAVVEPGVAFKSGLLTYSNSNEITVTTAFESKGTFSAGGVKQVFMGQPASRALMIDGAQTLTSVQKSQLLSNIGAAAAIGRYAAALSSDVTPSINTITNVLSLGNPTGAGSGTFRVFGKMSFKDTGGAGKVFARITDGTTLIDVSGYVSTPAANAYAQLICEGIITDPAGALVFQMYNPTSGTGKAVAHDTGSGNIETQFYAQKIG